MCERARLLALREEFYFLMEEIIPYAQMANPQDDGVSWFPITTNPT